MSDSLSPVRETVSFGTKGASIAGSICGTTMAIGVPWVVLSHGQLLPTSMVTALVWVGMGAGVLVALTSAFFGVVIPTHVGHEADEKL